MSAAGPPQGIRPLGGMARSGARGDHSAAGPSQGTRPLGGTARSDARGDHSAAGPSQGTRPLGGTARSDARGDHKIDGRLALLALWAMTLAMPGRAQTPAPAEPVPAAAAVSQQCEAAQRKGVREQKALTATADGITRDQRAREGCTSRSVCARYDDAIRDAQRRMV